MPPLIILGIIGGLGAGGYAMSQTADAAEASAKLVKWAAVAGGVYVSYRAMKTAGVIK